MTEHTPGPWEAIPRQDPKALSFHYFTVNNSNGGIAANEANARLISAAPDLLAALEALVAVITAPPITGMAEIAQAAKKTIVLTGQARAAIAKARNQGS